jgi:hypothetical protein
VKVIVILLVTGLHAPLFFEVRVRITLPAVVSALLGVYVALSVVLLGVNTPVPLLLHCAEPVLELPFSEIISLLAQTVWFEPAFTTAGTSTVTDTVPAEPVQPFAVAVTE